GQVTRILPGHGPLVPDAAATVRFYLEHRAERLDEVRAALAAGDTEPRQVVERVYADVPKAVWPYAELSVRAQLDYLGYRSG
ncbi:MAG: MBL fold metallo-hydrolase, partial [Actinomycetota bacterium]|nr:MBL fold metallo-hydrolase [Actinomycetota bacterium]